jgi:hypothetical protein
MRLRRDEIGVHREPTRHAVTRSHAIGLQRVDRCSARSLIRLDNDAANESGYGIHGRRCERIGTECWRLVLEAPPPAIGIDQFGFDPTGKFVANPSNDRASHSRHARTMPDVELLVHHSDRQICTTSVVVPGFIVMSPVPTRSRTEQQSVASEANTAICATRSVELLHCRLLVRGQETGLGEVRSLQDGRRNCDLAIGSDCVLYIRRKPKLPEIRSNPDLYAVAHFESLGLVLNIETISRNEISPHLAIVRTNARFGRRRARWRATSC